MTDHYCQIVKRPPTPNSGPLKLRAGGKADMPESPANCTLTAVLPYFVNRLLLLPILPLLYRALPYVPMCSPRHHCEPTALHNTATGHQTNPHHNYCTPTTPHRCTPTKHTTTVHRLHPTHPIRCLYGVHMVSIASTVSM